MIDIVYWLLPILAQVAVVSGSKTTDPTQQGDCSCPSNARHPMENFDDQKSRYQSLAEKYNREDEEHENAYLQKEQERKDAMGSYMRQLIKNKKAL